MLSLSQNIIPLVRALPARLSALFAEYSAADPAYNANFRQLLILFNIGYQHLPTLVTEKNELYPCSFILNHAGAVFYVAVINTHGWIIRFFENGSSL